MENSSTSPSKVKPVLVLNEGLQERLRNAEAFMNLPPVTSMKTTYERLKIIEDRILYLEAVSPEYKHFVVIHFFLFMQPNVFNKIFFSIKQKANGGDFQQKSSKIQKKVYSAMDIDLYMQEISNS